MYLSPVNNHKLLCYKTLQQGNYCLATFTSGVAWSGLKERYFSNTNNIKMKPKIIC